MRKLRDGQTIDLAYQKRVGGWQVQVGAHRYTWNGVFLSLHSRESMFGSPSSMRWAFSDALAETMVILHAFTPKMPDEQRSRFTAFSLMLADYGQDILRRSRRYPPGTIISPTTLLSLWRCRAELGP